MDNEKKENNEQNENDFDAEMFKQIGQIGILNRSGILPINIIGEIEGHTELGEGRKATK